MSKIRKYNTPVADVKLQDGKLVFLEKQRERVSIVAIFFLPDTGLDCRTSVYKPIGSILNDASELCIDHLGSISTIKVESDKVEKLLSKAIGLLEYYYSPGDYEVKSIDWTGKNATLLLRDDCGEVLEVEEINFRRPVKIYTTENNSFKLRYGEFDGCSDSDNYSEPNNYAEYHIKGSPVDLRNFKVVVENKDPTTVTFTDVDTKKRTFNLAGILVHYNEKIHESELILETVEQNRKLGSRHLVKISGLSEKDYYFPLGACDKKFLLYKITDFLNNINVLVHHHVIKAQNDEIIIDIPTIGIFINFQVDKSFEIKDLGDKIKIIAKNRSECFTKDSDWNFQSFKNRLSEVYNGILDKYPDLRPNTRKLAVEPKETSCKNEISEDDVYDSDIDNKADSIGIQITKNLCYISAADRNIAFRKNKFISCYSDENTITILLEPNNHIKLSVLNTTGHEVVKKIYDAMSD